ADSVKNVLDLKALSCEVLPFGALEPAEYLKNIDFWVCMHSDSLVESFGMAIVEAMASGCVVVLPPYMEELFGAGAIYAEPSDVESIVRSYWTDSALYARQSASAIRVVRDRYSSSAFTRRMFSLARIERA